MVLVQFLPLFVVVLSSVLFCDGVQGVVKLMLLKRWENPVTNGNIDEDDEHNESNDVHETKPHNTEERS